MKIRTLIVGLALAVTTIGLQAAPSSARTTGPAVAAPCGYYTTHVAWGADDAWYNHCGGGTICIWVDVNGWTGRSDYATAVGRGITHLGTTFYVNNAWYVGLPHPSLGCRIY